MKTYEFKNILFEYFYDGITKEYPELKDKVYRERLRSSIPDFPYVVLRSGERVRINKRFEMFNKDGQNYIRAQFRHPVTFSVYDLNSDAMSAEKFTDNVVDSIETFFTGTTSTHFKLFEKGIVINELLSSGVIDKSSFCKTSQQFCKEITIIFEYEDIRTITSEAGLELDINITHSG